MYEAGKAAARRGKSFLPYIQGKVLDIGCGPDPCSKYYDNITEFKGWDLEDGDANFLASVPDNYYDTVHSSHCLEHMVDAKAAFKHWIRVCKPGGYIVTVVPDEFMYERGNWPSIFNTDHKWMFRVGSRSNQAKSINVLEWVNSMWKDVQLVSLTRAEEGFDPKLPKNQDQTLGPAECAIEFILRKN